MRLRHSICNIILPQPRPRQRNGSLVMQRPRQSPRNIIGTRNIIAPRLQPRKCKGNLIMLHRLRQSTHNTVNGNVIVLITRRHRNMFVQ